MYIYIHVYIYMYIHTERERYKNMCLFAYVYIHIYIYIYIHSYTYIIYVYVYVYIDVRRYYPSGSIYIYIFYRCILISNHVIDVVGTGTPTFWEAYRSLQCLHHPTIQERYRKGPVYHR